MLARAARGVLVARRAFSAPATVPVPAPAEEILSESPSKCSRRQRDTLVGRFLRLAFQKRSAVVTLNKWAEEGKTLQKYHLNRVVRELRSYKRYDQAVKICEWMTTQENLRLFPGDYAVHLDLVAKVRGLNSAEKFFEDLPSQMIDANTCTSLLHCYVQYNLPAKAEALMKTMSERGFLNNALPYNHMLTLYISNHQFEKVPPLVEELKKSTTPDIFTYNLLLSISANRDDLGGAEKILLEINKKNLKADWVTYSTLTSMYTKAGHLEKAKKALKEMEMRVSRQHRVAFASLVTLHANLNDKKAVLKIWQRMESSFRKMNDAEYTSMVSSLVKLGDVGQAERIYSEWEAATSNKDPRLPNVLLQLYVKEESMDKAEKFHKQMVEKGFVSTFTTWETLALGYLGVKKIDKVLECLKKALSSLQKWKPNVKLVQEILVELEKIGDTEGAEEFLVILRDAGYVTTEIYNSLLRIYKNAGKTPLNVVERMEQDRVELNEETHQLLHAMSNLCG